MLKKRASNEQLEYLVAWLEERPAIASGLGLGGRRQTNEAWSALSEHLNAIGFGTRKTGEKWQQAWRDLKHNIKKKAVKLHMERSRLRGSGAGRGGTMRVPPLSILEERVLNIIGPEAVYGLDLDASSPLENVEILLDLPNDRSEEENFQDEREDSRKDVKEEPSHPVRRAFLETSTSRSSGAKRKMTTETDKTTPYEKKALSIEDRILQFEEKKLDQEARKIELEAKKIELEVKKLDLVAKRLELEAKKVDLEVKKIDLEANKIELEVKKIELEAKKVKLEGKWEIFEEKKLEEMDSCLRDV